MSDAKRLIDIVVATAAALLCSPLCACLAIGIKLSSRGPVFFRQRRAGLHGEDFSILKFRTMHEWKVESDETFKGDPRVFRFGRFLREFHLDELPQLINVLKGEMSLVGPRPTLPSQVVTYSDHQRRRLEVRPGLTGLAQVRGNNLLTWDERIEIDIEYVETRSLLLDLRILWKTIGVVLRRSGVYGSDGHVRGKY